MSKDTFHAVLFGILLIGLIVIGYKFDPKITVSAQTKTEEQDIAPYRFADTQDGTHLYKAVHKGCELFIATKAANTNVTVAIATGRGCK